jgi:acetyl esterase/lipase
LVHGGCWLAAYDYQYFNHLAAALAQVGVASWSVEYRRLGEAGGGWPNTLLDVARATDHLRQLAETLPLDTGRVVSIGHSAGGHLALWLAARGQLSKDSDLYRPQPLPLLGAVGLAAITDLASYRIGPPDSCNASVDQLMGGTDTQQAARYAQASPLALLPLGVPQVLVQGGADPIVPPASVSRYVEAARQAGDAVTERIDATLGHFDPAVPGNPLGDAGVQAVLSLLGEPRPAAKP